MDIIQIAQIVGDKAYQRELPDQYEASRSYTVNTRAALDALREIEAQRARQERGANINDIELYFVRDGETIKRVVQHWRAGVAIKALESEGWEQVEFCEYVRARVLSAPIEHDLSEDELARLEAMCQ